MRTCMRGRDYIGAARRRIRKAILAERGQLSRKTGHAVDYETAKRVFLDSELAQFAEKFHAEYCRRICRDRAVCRAKAGARCPR